MASHLLRLHKKKLVKPPNYVISNLQYEVITGSMAYGVSTDASDMDVVGFCMPPLNQLFPHRDGYIHGFHKPLKSFEQWQNHHIIDKNAGKEYDYNIYNIAKYFRLCVDCNPNMIDTLFVPQNLILHATPIAQKVRENRHLFLSKRAWEKYKGYAYSQLKKMSVKERTGKRKATIEKFGYDVKFGYHVVRLLGFVEQILMKHDLDLQQDNRRLMAIRAGEWTEEHINEFFTQKEQELEKLYNVSTLRVEPDMGAITDLLMECVRMHYDFESVTQPTDKSILMDELEAVLNKHRV